MLVVSIKQPRTITYHQQLCVQPLYKNVLINDLKLMTCQFIGICEPLYFYEMLRSYGLTNANLNEK